MTLAPIERTAVSVSQYSLDEVTARKEYAKALAASGLLPQAFRAHPENVLVAIEYGDALGIAPIVAMAEINVINGTPSLSAALMASLARSAGHKVRTTGDATQATCTIIRADDPDFEHTFTWDERKARAANLWGKGHWAKDPGTMLKWRAISEAVRFTCPEVLAGIRYTPDEVEEFSPPTQAREVRNPTAPAPTASIADAIAADEPVEAELLPELPEP